MPNHCTEMGFASFLSGRFITAIVVNPPEMKLAKRTSVWQGTNLPYLIHDSSNSLDFVPTNFEDVLPGMLLSYQPS